MNSLEVRKKFFDFFQKNQHTVVQSSSLIPAQDPTLLFANAGMNQFKDVFLGKETRSYKRAVSIQKCMRAGGKHNDLENVGFTKRHLTFFEMMGNFSFGDYFKKEAIQFAWDFLTKELSMDASKLYPSVYKLDQEAFDIWNKVIGVPENKISKLGEADNFWQMGDTGPCGPCSEIYFDRGAELGCKQADCAPGCSCDRFLEIWNLVFMQFDKQPDGSDKPLKQTGVDTGMGLERLCAILQNKDSVFETDLFTPLIKKIEEVTKISYEKSSPEIKAAFRVLADHIRSSSFAIADGCTPSNEGRGYVLRKIIRRAALFAQKISEKNIFPEVVPSLVKSMSGIYPELAVQEKHIVSLLKSEVEKFAQNLINGQQILEKYFKEQENKKIILGEQAFKLYDTYGFPLELTKVIAQERGYTVDTENFEKEMEKQRLQSGKKITDVQFAIDESVQTIFTGYDEHQTTTKIIGLFVDNQQVTQVDAGAYCAVITTQSPFYVECGGQISDQGFIKIKDKEAKLLGLKKIDNAIAAFIEAPSTLKINDEVVLVVDSPTRINTMKNHTATHLLQAALMTIVGKSVKQSGSVVTPDYLRFDFTYHENLTAEQVQEIEFLVNKKIMDNIPVKISQTTYKDAVAKGVIAFFGEKYNPEKVRVVEVPGFSAELCGGTHVTATGDIGCFKITEISALSAGNRRLVAVTGPKALELFQDTFNTVKSLSQEFKVTFGQVLDSVNKQKEILKNTQTQLKQIKKQAIKSQIPEWLKQIDSSLGIPFLFLNLKDISSDELREIGTEISAKNPGLYFLSSQKNYFVNLSQQFADKLNLQELSAWLKQEGFLGGGSKLTLQGSASSISEDFKDKLKNWLKKALK